MTIEKWINNAKINVNTNSWFDINVVTNKTKHQYISKKRPINKYLKCNKIQIFPDATQKKIILSWMNLFIDMYNDTNYFLNNHIYDFKKKKIKKNKNEYLNFRKLRDNHIKNNKKILCKNKINKHLLDEAINHNVAKHKTSITNYLDNNINFFRLRNMKKIRRKKILIIESRLFSKSKNGFCTSVLKNIKSTSSLKDVKKTSILQYDKHTRKFILYVPVENESTNQINRSYKCGIDPGIRTFLTCYSKNKVIEIGNNCYDNLRKNYKQIDIVNKKYKEKNIRKKAYDKCINRNYDKINNKIKDLHFKTSNYLCKLYDNITIGKLSTKRIISNNNNLNKKSKRSVCSLSHFRFREILEYQCIKNNVKLKIVDESYTTKTCSNCSTINDVGKEKIFSCSNCLMRCDRDVNAAKNIYNKK